MLNPNWLKTFKTLVEVNHFTKTAQALFMTQPGVTQHIQKLEQACGVQLLIKQGKGFELTEQGLRIYQYANQLIEQQQLLLNELQVDDENQGIVSLSCSGSLAQWLYPMFIGIQQQHPKLSVEFEAAPNSKIIDNVLNGITSLGLVTQQPSSAELEVIHIGDEELLLVLPNSIHSNKVTQQSLVELGLIKHPDAEHYVSRYLRESGEPHLSSIQVSKIPRVSYINQLNQILYPIVHGIGFTVLPKSAVVSSPWFNELNIYQPKQPVKDQLFLIYKANRPLAARYQRFIHLISESLR
ncbi:LysR family transcriptional regulator [Vibrio gallicus]|uniref:LysR family transcriptional regulator n=1 Tax=Vibrio gallicus TaxID=190897 RepID=UPI0021C35652|nr:LysR family transcriptional regulator [Vibrio gallicus]